MSQRDPADETLVRRLREGDQAAGRLLFERYVPILRPFVRGRLAVPVRRKVGESDVIQSAYLAVARRLDDFEDRGPGSFRRWLLGVLENKVRHELRRFGATQKRALQREALSDDALNDAPAASTETPSRVAMRAEERKVLFDRVDALATDQREVVRLIHGSGMTLTEAASRMGRSSEAVRKLYARALAKLMSDAELRRRMR